MNEYELYHHGIKGQKWGVRRYQNEDGSLTAEGQARYNKGGAIGRNSTLGMISRRYDSQVNAAAKNHASRVKELRNTYNTKSGVYAEKRSELDSEYRKEYDRLSKDFRDELVRDVSDKKAKQAVAIGALETLAGTGLYVVGNLASDNKYVQYGSAIVGGYLAGRGVKNAINGSAVLNTKKQSKNG